MAPPNLAQHASCEANIHLAILALNATQIHTERRAAATFKVSRATLHHRRAGRPARRDCQPNSKKLTQLEDEVIIKYILNLDNMDLRLRTRLYVIWLISCWLPAAEARLGRSGLPTLSGVQTLSKRVSTERTIGSELYARIQPD
jgi:hypothetical protein